MYNSKTPLGFNGSGGPPPIGMHVRGPQLNPQRDPRWGRCHCARLPSWATAPVCLVVRYLEGHCACLFGCEVLGGSLRLSVWL